MDQLPVWIGLIGGGYLFFRYNRWQNEEAKKGADKIVCPHCGERGCVTGKSVVRGKGVSGGKAAGAVMTGGASVFATGLSKNQRVRNLKCSNCNSEWDVA